MNFLEPYSRSEYIKFFQDNLLTDNFRIEEEKLSLEFNSQFIKRAELIGRDKSLELEVYEIQHSSENDPRVGISKEFFRFMSSYGSKHALAFFYSPNSDNYRLSLATVELSLEGSKIKREYSNPRRYSFFLGPDSKVHTPYNFLIKKGKVKDFNDLQNRFSIEVVNKEFYKEIANWYFWAQKKVKFPNDAEAEKNGREISVIRLITRLVFIWFMKVRKLIPEDLFDVDCIKEILGDLKLGNDNYYKAILQNLFFATLNTRQNERRFTSKLRGYKGFSHDFGNHNVYRYEELFTKSEEVIEKYFMSIPFLNGGLFECLDYKTKSKEERKYIDGFTSIKSQQPSVPNYLFFSEDKIITEINKDYGTTNKTYNVRGLINTLSLYNFTIDESDPNDADVALDPELLGKVFENLLASYNPETAKTARKSTGSYYTPRPIVDYMVDESLKQYLKNHVEAKDLDNKLNILFSSEDPSNPFDVALTKKLVNLIDSLRIVDPAVGSGAFPMRILNRLVFLLHKLDPNNSLWKQSQIEGIKKSVKDPILQRKFIEETERKFKEKNPNYGRKLYLIEKCIYGVDIQQIAVEIAKLRFFISLLVDEKINFEKKDDNYEIEPLPNLDFKLMQGNSLMYSFAGIDFISNSNTTNSLFDYEKSYKPLISEFEELKAQHQNEPDANLKKELKEKIDEILLQIFEEKLKLKYPVLKELENKYIGLKEKQRLEVLNKEKLKLFKKIGIDLDTAEQDLIAYTEGRKQKNFFLWDIYFAEVFAEKGGFDILIGNPPYKILTRNNTELRELNFYLDEYNSIQGSYSKNIFTLFIEKAFDLLTQDSTLSYIVPEGLFKTRSYSKCVQEIEKNGYVKSIVTFTEFVFENAITGNLIFVFSKNEKGTLKRYHFNELFEIKEIQEMNNNLIKKIEYDASSLNSICKTFKGMVVKDRGSVISENPKNKKNIFLLGKNISKWVIESKFFCNYNQLEIVGGTKRISKHNQVPRILIRRTGDILCCAYLEEKALTESTLYSSWSTSKLITSKVILGLLNSKLLNYYNKKVNITNQQGFPQILMTDLELLPIKVPSPLYQSEIVKVVDNILIRKKNNQDDNIESLENQIDIIVYKLYNLTYEEVKIIDLEIDKIISKKDYEKFELK